jgi:lysozyme
VLCTIFTALGAKAQSEIVIDDNTIDASSVIYDGIDVSNYQRDIDWRATAKDKNIKFVYVKATEGANHKQHRYIYNIENARKHGIKVGSYHFFRTTSSVESQFRNFISIVKDPRRSDQSPKVRSIRQDTSRRGEGSRMLAFEIEYRLKDRRFAK